MRRARTLILTLTLLLAAFDLTVALIWAQWCRQHGYREQAQQLGGRG